MGMGGLNRPKEDETPVSGPIPDDLPKLEIRIPEELRTAASDSVRKQSQDQEWCEVRVDGEWRPVRFHDYDEIYRIPGLYEHLFYEELKCDSPRVLSGMIEQELRRLEQDPADLSVLDVGAGNGMVGELLAAAGVGEIVGVDIIEEAKMAAERDRPGVYDEYAVFDLTDRDAPEREALADRDFNCLTSVAALGFGDIPPHAFSEAYNLIDTDGLVAFSIKDTMIDEETGSFSELVDEALNLGSMELSTSQRYLHRYSLSGDPLHYVAMIARKVRDLDPEVMLAG